MSATQAIPPDARAAARGRLRAYQHQLAARLEAARSRSRAPARLALRSGARGHLVALDEVGAILPLAPWSPVPHTRPWYLGVANLRGRLFSVIDLSQYCGFEPIRVDKDCRLLTFAAGLGCNAALLVSGLAGLRQVTADGVVDLPSPDWSVLSLKALARDPRFLDVVPSA